VDLGLQPEKPPDRLFHGTAILFVESILRTGLHSQSRQHVHLSSDLETANKVGKRHGKPVVLAVDAKAMVETGFDFLLSDNGVWLVAEVPPKYLCVLDETDS
jgi:putative RNA 2'-phosphotransferase